MTTGIQVQLIDVERVCAGGPADPGLVRSRCGPPALIINIDYAFGEQAEEIMRTLLLLFGRNVRSINVLGKAGALLGGRGGVIAPTAFIEQANDAFQPLPGESPEALGGSRRPCPGRSVLAGPLLTVGGTLLQNRAMLQFYRRIWGCVGLEMEGIWYLRAVLEAEELGVLRRERQAPLPVLHQRPPPRGGEQPFGAAFADRGSPAPLRDNPGDARRSPRRSGSSPLRPDRETPI